MVKLIKMLLQSSSESSFIATFSVKIKIFFNLHIDRAVTPGHVQGEFYYLCICRNMDFFLILAQLIVRPYLNHYHPTYYKVPRNDEFVFARD